MAKLLEMLDQAWRVQKQKREIRELRGEVDKLRGQNERMRKAMRRCITCEFRIEVEGRAPTPPDPSADARAKSPA